MVVASIPKGKLAFCATQTDTLDSFGRLLMRADDTILMVYDCEKPFFVEPQPVTASAGRRGLSESAQNLLSLLLGSGYLEQ
jgi:hypothetical protein